MHFQTRAIWGVSVWLRLRPNTVYKFLIYTGILYVKDLANKFDFFKTTWLFFKHFKFHLHHAYPHWSKDPRFLIYSFGSVDYQQDSRYSLDGRTCRLYDGRADYISYSHDVFAIRTTVDRTLSWWRKNSIYICYTRL